MKIVAFNGSGREDGNTLQLLEKVLEPLVSSGMDIQLVQLAGRQLQGCIACYRCFAQKDKRCVLTGDGLNDYIASMSSADAVVLGSPSYFGDVSSEMKALLDRSGMVCRANDFLLRRKLGVAVVAARRAGALHTYDTMNHFFLMGQMVTIGSSYWNIGLAAEKGGVGEDHEAMRTMKDLGENVLWLLRKIKS